MGKQLTINDPLRLLPSNPDSWPDDLKAAIRKCCCGGTSSPPPTVVTFPFDCCQSQGGTLPSNFSVRVSGTLNHDGTYPMKPWPIGELPDWYPSNAPQPPSTLLCGVSLGAIGAFKFISDLYEDFTISGSNSVPAGGGCPGFVVTTDTYEFFYFVVYDSCGIDVYQIYRYTSHTVYAGGGVIGGDGFGITPAGPCAPVDTTYVQWWPVPVVNPPIACTNYMSTRAGACTKITCDPVSFKAMLRTPAAAFPYLGLGVSGTVQWLGLSYFVLNYEPPGVCLAGQPTGAIAEIVL